MNRHTGTSLIQTAEIIRYIPHRSPFILVDALYYCDLRRIVSSFDVRPDHLLVYEGYLQEAGIIENIAQTIALKSGYEADPKPGCEPPLGFIASIKDVQIHRLVPIGKTLITRAEVLVDLGNILVVKGISCYEQFPVASCEMRLFLEQ